MNEGDREALHVLTVVGARPQFVKAAAVSRAIASNNEQAGGRTIAETLVHTGQHYDREMSDVFFEELLPDRTFVDLEVGSGSHGQQTGEMLMRLERTMETLQPHIVLVFGDTNSTLAGALAAAKLTIPVAHVEAGLRSHRRSMPEEINRVLADHISTWLFCPSQLALDNLRGEGITVGTHLVGDVMYDVLVHEMARGHARTALDVIGLKPNGYALATVHRAENTDDPDRLAAILKGLRSIAAQGLPVLLPLHPRTAAVLQGDRPEGVILCPPLPYREMIASAALARVVLTDSGGLQKEAFWLGVPCVTLRDETEWPETVESGWNALAGADADAIEHLAWRGKPAPSKPEPYGRPGAAERIVTELLATAGTQL